MYLTGRSAGPRASVAARPEVFGMRPREAVEPGDTATAVRLLLDQYEQSGLAHARAAQQERRVPALKAPRDDARARHRAWIERPFAHALPDSEPERRQRVAAF